MRAMAKRNTKKTKMRRVSSHPSPERTDLKHIDQGLTKIQISTICRLCKSTDGPFLNIFDSDAVTAKKIEEVLPIVVAGNDDLPQKICFRCSAKVEELYEFIQKCLKTQQQLKVTFKKKSVTKTVTQKSLWEENLNKAQTSNDGICDAMITKAIERIKDVSSEAFKPVSQDTVKLPSLTRSHSPFKSIEQPSFQTIRKPTKYKGHVESKKGATDTAKIETISSEKSTRTLRSNNTGQLLAGSNECQAKNKKPTNPQQDICVNDHPQNIQSHVTKRKSKKMSNNTSERSSPTQDVNNMPIKDKQANETEQKIETNPKPFNIMDYVEVFKVSSVGVLYLCNLCDRNFLKKDIVLSHGCAKNGLPKKDIISKVMPVQQPKLSAPSVMYITTKKGDVPKKALSSENNSDRDTQMAKPMTEELNNATVASASPVRKPRIGPASKVRREPETTDITETQNSTQQKLPVPSYASRYKLVPGPNNTFSLVDAASVLPVTANQAHAVKETHIKSVGTKRKIADTKDHSRESNREKQYVSRNSKNRTSNPEIICLDRSSSPSTETLPYPVGLFQTPHSSDMYTPIEPPPQLAGFCISNAKKQLYSIVPTGNPSKLLISSKPQPQIPVEDFSKKQSKKKKSNVPVTEEPKQPFPVTLEDTGPPQDPAFFTFINVDPLLQPSYVLPTDNINRGSQISTSMITRNKIEKNIPDNKNYHFSCHMCGKVFSQENMLLEHINFHYKKIDQGNQRKVIKKYLKEEVQILE